ncbi:Serine/threonine-protein kinase PK-1 [Aquisphaera giovannonii]|uniref:non-specific serine/threonine protein kinase n=1 Tax=Aquisphaera giovannonii TaxID=406548 RepID=A0A5B9VX30_9BACT|nr:serine/threonine-protein kinase [Aquisphaera giovannonii]QEH32893.1 Serine/threonine-protein kinase PK-1 [Aquisphaera giovannonii]
MSQGLIGERLGSFRLEEVLGSGAMGVVFRAVHEGSGRPAAVKIVHEDLGQKGRVFERFEREADILKQFRHPNIVRWLAVGRYKGTSYFAMEYADGITAEKLLQDRGPLPWREVVDLGIQLCSALSYAHEKNVIHRDLKPSNIMITKEGKLKLTDFGIAKDLDRTTQLTAPGRTLGTAAYMAPEQIRGTPAVSHKTDLYALGILFYQMLTGATPFEGASAVVLMHNHLNQAPPRPSDKVATIPKELDELVVKLMAKAPSDRPWDAAAVEHMLTELRDRAEQGKSIPMVWAEPDAPDAVHPGRAPVAKSPTRARKKGRKPSLASSAIAGGVPSGEDEEAGWLARARLETMGLVLALLAIAGGMAYVLWPPSAETLYRKAEALMQSSRRSDWITARDEYLDPLDSKHPGHPYGDQVRKWRDRIFLEDAENRARNLSSPVKTAFSEPHSNAERQYVAFSALVEKATAEGNDPQAAAYWREMARLMKPDDPEERPWYVLALHRAEEVEARMEKRRAFVLDQLSRAEHAFQSGNGGEAETIREMLRKEYGRYADLADLLGAGHGAPAAPAARPEDDRHRGAGEPSPATPPSVPPGPPG